MVPMVVRQQNGAERQAMCIEVGHNRSSLGCVDQSDLIRLSVSDQIGIVICQTGQGNEFKGHGIVTIFG